MLLWGAVVALGNTALLDPTPGHLMVGLAVVVAALLVAAATAIPVAPGAWAPSGRLGTRRSRAIALPRFVDPNAAGRPRPRAPSGGPATA
ncbi:hypothetical protein HH310_05410 [Actinoplanes sp. TBRC 11911]|uniref:DUF6412 domain-containing protein n=1 Tax=Actinoplanes sp. TBRC 11911 TaxID=2729386 RepID=UPI00145D35FE|nr:DUF6412 domain-containing protein [Actinoplanes sp. TBRC 11911]NMO50631.1 hypothetical protein [Actinoplanes sp. TBRC 11911]